MQWKHSISAEMYAMNAKAYGYSLEFPGDRVSNDSGVVKKFQCFGLCIFRNFRNKAFIQRYVVRRRLSPDPKYVTFNDPECLRYVCDDGTLLVMITLNI